VRARLWYALGLLCLALPASGQTDQGWPTAEWPESNPAAQGMNPEPLQRLDAEFASGKHGYIDDMLVIRNGQVVYEKRYPQDYDAAFHAQKDQHRGPYNYFDPDWHPYYKRGALHTLQSVSKSVTATLIGIAIGDGKISGPDAKVAAYFDDYPTADQDPRRAAMTLRDLLTMTAGIQWDEDTYEYTDSRNTCAAMEASPNWTGYVLGLPMAANPGSTYVYSSGVTMLLDHILFRATGQHALAYAEQRLFAPLGIREFYWKQTPAGETDAEGGLYLRARDLAKLGHLYARDGIWEGRRILPEGWAAAVATPRVTPGSDAGDWRYGYQWWLVPYAGGAQKYALTGIGYGGQLLLVLPEYELIAVFTGWNIFGTSPLSPDYTLKYLLEAIRTAP
jgi:CubicO group peptidase (beta-lactamase class C family)